MNNISNIESRDSHPKIGSVFPKPLLMSSQNECIFEKNLNHIFIL